MFTRWYIYIYIYIYILCIYIYTVYIIIYYNYIFHHSHSHAVAYCSILPAPYYSIPRNLFSHDCDLRQGRGLLEHGGAKNPNWSGWWLSHVEPTPLKNMKVSWDHYSQYMEK